MFGAWYESAADRKEHVLFKKRIIVSESFHGRWSAMPHFHNSIEIAFCVKGTSKVKINGKVYDMKEGTVVFIDHFERHQYNFKIGAEIFVVLVSASFFDTANNLKKLKFPTVMEKCDGFERIKNFLELSYSACDIDSMVYKIGFINMLVSLMMQTYPYELDNERAKIGEILIEVLKYINEHCTENISVSEIAKRFGYSPNYLSMLFNKYVEMSFREYLNRQRIAEYTELRKEQPELTSYKAAELCGFKSLSSFYDILKKMRADSDIIDG